MRQCWTHHEQNSIFQWPCRLDGLFLCSVAVLPHDALLYHHSGLWVLILTVEEELTCFLVLYRWGRK